MVTSYTEKVGTLPEFGWITSTRIATSANLVDAFIRVRGCFGGDADSARLSLWLAFGRRPTQVPQGKEGEWRAFATYERGLLLTT